MNQVNRHIFSGMQILIDQQWQKDQALVIEGAIIKAIIPAEMIEHHLPAKEHVYPADYYLTPGFIDLHVHGAAGHDVMDATQAALCGISEALAQEGVTGFLATTMSADAETIKEVVSNVAKYGQDVTGAAILGIHLEGPFIAPYKKGAQQTGMLPHVKLFKQWQSAADHTIKIVTLAPELAGALDLIKALHETQVIASIGHTNATFLETTMAIEAGCTHATHLFNAMRSLHQREPGAVGAILLADSVVAELIVDEFHLHPAVVEIVLRLKGKDRLLLISDAMRAKCLGDGDYDLGGQTVTVKNRKATLADGTLAGSTLRIPRAILNMAKVQGCSLIDAIEMASINPARALGLSSRKGSLEVGKEADMVLLNAQFEVLLTLKAGKPIYEFKG